jgi:threonine dehydratase
VSEEITLDDIQQAKERIQKVVHKTPLDFSTTLSTLTDNKVYIKEESLQKTGSFKIRGAYNKTSQLNAEQRKAGVIAASAGNHAQGVAYAASLAGIKATIVMPIGAPIIKLMATRNYQAEVILAGEGYDEAWRDLCSCL